MSENRPNFGLLDTSTVIVLQRLPDATSLPEIPLISSVTLAELSAGPLATEDPTLQAARMTHVQQAEALFQALPFDAAAARAFGRVSASLRKSGRKSSARAFDALIAATAIAHGLHLYTCNPSDFVGIDELDVRAVPHPGTF